MKEIPAYMILEMKNNPMFEQKEYGAEVDSFEARMKNVEYTYNGDVLDYEGYSFEDERGRY